VRWTAVGIAAAATIYSAFTYQGPYRWLAELQLAVFGGYLVQITFLLTLILCGAVAIGIVQLARRGRLVASASEAQVAAEKSTAERLNQRMRVAQGPLMVIVVGGVFAFVGARDLWLADRGRTLQHLDAAQLERGEQPAGTWLELRGVLVSDGAVSARTNGHESVYVPLVSEAWQSGTRVGALLKVPADKDPGAGPYRGGVDPEGVPGMVRAVYEKAGVDTSQALVLEWRKRPAEAETRAKWFFGIGSIFAAVGGVLLVRELRRSAS
jgi:hypothetical protein